MTLIHRVRQGAITVLFLGCVVGAAASAGMATSRFLMSAPAVKLTGLVAQPPVLDFGSLNQGEARHAEFTLVNHGPFPVTIDQVAEGCSCRQLTLDTKELPVGSSAKLSLTWHIGARRGTVNDQVQLIYHDHRPLSPNQAGPTPRLFQLAVRAEVKPEIEYAPAKVEFTRGQPGRAEVQLSPGTRPTFRVSHVAVSSREMTAHYDEVAHKIFVEYRSVGKANSVQECLLHVDTDGVHQNIIEIPVILR